MKPMIRVAFVALGVLLVTLGLNRAFGPEAETRLPVMGSVPAFELRDQKGEIFTEADLPGKVHVVNFIFTSCPGICPVLTRHMAELEARTRDIGAKVHFISLTVDPETDTTERLREYALQYRANLSRWAFLTGTREALERLITQGFHTAMGGKAGEGAMLNIAHSEKFVVVDDQARIRAFVGVGSEERRSELESIVRRLVDEIGGSRLAVAPPAP